jgi:hypothetical protein
MNKCPGAPLKTKQQHKCWSTVAKRRPSNMLATSAMPPAPAVSNCAVCYALLCCGACRDADMVTPDAAHIVSPPLAVLPDRGSSCRQHQCSPQESSRYSPNSTGARQLLHMKDNPTCWSPAWPQLTPVSKYPTVISHNAHKSQQQRSPIITSQKATVHKTPDLGTASPSRGGA